MSEEETTVQRKKKEVPSDNKEYKKQEYWDERFAKEEKYEWLVGYSHVAPLIEPLVKKDDRILIVGCGNSELSADMYNAGYHNITNIDYSAVVIKAQEEKNADKPTMKWLEMDMTDLKFEDGSFDVVLDKCAMDALLVDEGDPWNPDASCREAVDRMLTHISRVLKPDGQYLQVSFGQPHFRKRFYFCFDKYGWDVESQTFGDGFGYFFYRMKKQSANAKSSQEAEATSSA